VKRIFLVSGLLAVILLITFLTGAIDYNNSLKKALTEGNRFYVEGNYEQALEAYKKGLEKEPENPRLNYNSGQTYYKLNDYRQAAKYYGKAPDEPDKYLNLGNCSLKLGDAVNDAGQKQEYYRQALETYKQGILEFPKNIHLKYNYEYVKKRFDQQEKSNNNNQQENEKKNEENNQQENGRNQDDVIRQSV
jgi:Ca-activated chloride channel homolog